MRAERNREITVRISVEDEQGNLVDADAAPSVTVKDGAGVVVSSGTATRESTGVYRYVIPPQSLLDTLDTIWAYSVGSWSRTQHVAVQVVDQRLVSLNELRSDSQLSSLSGTVLAQVLDTVEDWLRVVLRVPPVREGYRVALRAPEGPQGSWQLFGGPVLRPVGYYHLGPLYSVVVDGVAWTASQLANVRVTDVGYELQDQSYWVAAQWIELHGEYGIEQPPQQLRRAGKLLARYIARESDLPLRATQISTEASTILLSTPSPSRPVGIPEIDGIVNSLRVPMVA